MKVLVYMILGITIVTIGGTAESKCSTLLMCPSFCMKLKHGCYVCDCGMFSNYLHRAAEHMAANSNKQHLQTGTQLSSYTSGYNDVDSNTDVPSNLNGQSTRQYINMMQMGFQYMNLQPYNTKPMLPQMSAKDYRGYGHYYNDMPGMSCTPLDERCPSSCWTTDVYTGCLYCGCALETDGHAFKNQYQATDSPVPTTVKNPNIPLKEPVQTDRNDTQHSKRMVSAHHPYNTNITDSMSVNENIVIWAVPTAGPTSLGLIDSLRTTFSYAVPTPLPPTNKTSLLISVLKSDIRSTKNKTLYSDHTKANKMLQTKSKSKEQVHDSLTTPSTITDNQRYFASIIKEKNTKESVQSTGLRKLEQPLKPQITFRTSTVKTSTGNASSIPMHQSLANTGKENHLLDNSTTGGRNYYGFYLHAESG